MNKPITKLAISVGVCLLFASSSLAQDEIEDEIFELSPFTVDGSDDEGYRATSTLAGTRIRTSLKDVGSAISVVTEEFLRDTNATDNESLLIYTTNMEVGGSQGNFAGGGDGARVDTDAQRRAPNNSTRVRGLAQADNTRSFFPTDIPWDSYNVKRIDLQRGPNSILFGLGSPAGVINANVDQATFKDGGVAEIRLDDHGTWRATFNYNKVLIEDELSIRFATLQEDQKFQQDQAFEEDSRYFVAMKYQPKFLQGDSSNGTLTANYEYGSIQANRPRVIPPIDRITQWFEPGGMNKATYDSTTIDRNGGPTTQGSAVYDPWIGNNVVGRIFDGPVAVFDDGTGTASSYFMAKLENPDPDSVYRGVDDLNEFARKASLYGNTIGAWKSRTLNDPSIFNFYDNLMEGPNKSEWQDWEAYNITYAHNWMDNHLGIEIAFDQQDYVDGQTNILNNWGQTIAIDIMDVLPDGSSNPNVGRPFIGGDAQNNNERVRERKSFRVTGYYEHDFRDQSESLRWLGRHVFTGLYSDAEFDQFDKEWVRNAAANVNDGVTITGARRYVAVQGYLGPSLAGASSASGANIPALNSVVVPTGGPIVTDNGNVDLSVLSADTGSLNNLYDSANLADDSIESMAFVWQGFLFDGLVVPMFGYRDDEATARNAGNVPDNPAVTGAKLPFDPTWRLPVDENDLGNQNSAYDVASGINKTYSLVVHAPKAIMPEGIDLSLSYAESSNFRPDAGRKDLRGDPVGPSTGETEEYGLTLSAMNGKLNLRVNKYETKVFRDTLSDESIPGVYMIGAAEGWGYRFAIQALAEGVGNVGNFNQNYALQNPGAPYDAVTNPYISPNTTDLRYDPGPIGNLSPAAQVATIDAAKQAQDAALTAFMAPENRPDQQLLDFWNLDLTATADDPNLDGKTWSGTPAGGFALTGDTQSEGWEYELFYQPTDNWNISLNASKTLAKRINIAKTYADFVTERWELYQGDYGNVRLWGPWAGIDTVRSQYQREFYGNYLLATLLNDSNVPELRPWRFNLVTNYSFTDGKFAGFNVGGSYRWQDEITVGFPVVDGELGPIYDAANPSKGSTESNFDFWAGYQKALSDKVDWRVQLNIRNAFTGNELIPITVNPDGSAAASRIAPGRKITLTNTFTF